MNEHIGVSRGGKNTKIHAVVDALGLPLRVILSGGQYYDNHFSEELVKDFLREGQSVMGDKAYHVKTFKDFVQAHNAIYCVPPKINTRHPHEIDWWQYRERSNVERFFQKLKEYRRIATRYDKLANRFLAFVHLACIMIWLH